MSRGISTRNARIIRTAIESRCIPYRTGGGPEQGYWAVLDFAGLRERLYAWECVKDMDLAQRAQLRTAPWTLTTERVE